MGESVLGATPNTSFKRRALPDIRDGLEACAARRILYSMNKDGNTFDKSDATWCSLSEISWEFPPAW